MKTYPLKVIREAFHEIVDKSKPVKFTYYVPKSKPLKVKGRIQDIRANKKGLFIKFTKVYVNRKVYVNCGLYVKYIRWVSDPFDWDIINEKCIELIKKLPEKTVSGIVARNRD